MGKTVTHIERSYNGSFLLKPTVIWTAYCYREIVAQGKTKENCIRAAKEKGYAVPYGI